jgi:CheY-like chemotaxis protein
LPIHTNPPALRRKEKTPVASNGHSLHILVVEDDPLVRGIEAEYMISDGHTVETAADGCEGLDKFHAGKFDLVLVDRAMPEINGEQLIEAIKEMDPDMPMILVTGFPDILREDHEPQRANLILSKPFSHDSLRAAVGTATTLAGSESRTDVRAGLQLQPR